MILQTDLVGGLRRALSSRGLPVWTDHGTDSLITSTDAEFHGRITPYDYTDEVGDDWDHVPFRIGFALLVEANNDIMLDILSSVLNIEPTAWLDDFEDLVCPLGGFLREGAFAAYWEVPGFRIDRATKVFVYIAADSQ